VDRAHAEHVVLIDTGVGNDKPRASQSDLATCRRGTFLTISRRRRHARGRWTWW